MTILRPLFSYYGSKWRAVNQGAYPAPQHRTIVERFAGSMGYSLNYPHRRVIGYEPDFKIWSVWDYLLHESAASLLHLPDLEPGQTTDELDLCQEARWLIGLWVNRCSSTPKKTPTKAMRERRKGWESSFWSMRTRVRLAESVSRIRHWRVHLGTWEGCPVREIGEATWFDDPIYQVGTLGAQYRLRTLDYKALAASCRQLPGQVIVCEAKGADWLPFRDLYQGRSCRGKPRIEQIWTNDGQPDLFAAPGPPGDTAHNPNSKEETE